MEMDVLRVWDGVVYGNRVRTELLASKWLGRMAE